MKFVGVGPRPLAWATAVLIGLASARECSAQHYGPAGPERDAMRRQLWLTPSADPAQSLRATVFRPTNTTGRRLPLVIVNHGTDAATRRTVSMPVFRRISQWFVDRGYAVVLPQRRGHGATGGIYAEGQDTCRNPRHREMGNAAADDIEAVLGYMANQPFVDSSRITLVGVSSGAWASLALAARNPPGVKLVVNFSGGRGAYAWGRAGEICDPDQLAQASAIFGRTTRVPTVWFYAENDSYFGPHIAKRLHEAWTSAGGQAQLYLLPASGREGHAIADADAGLRLWGPRLDPWLGGDRMVERRTTAVALPRPRDKVN